jgi:hypothetical protein
MAWLEAASSNFLERCICNELITPLQKKNSRNIETLAECMEKCLEKCIPLLSPCSQQ